METTCKPSTENYFVLNTNEPKKNDHWTHHVHQTSTPKDDHHSLQNIFTHYAFPYLASPVAVSSWLTQALYTSTGLVLMPKFLSSMMSLTTGARSCLSVLWPRAPLLKLTTILMTVGLPVTMSWIWSTLELRHMDKVVELISSTKQQKQTKLGVHVFGELQTILNYYSHLCNCNTL